MGSGFCDDHLRNSHPIIPEANFPFFMAFRVLTFYPLLFLIELAGGQHTELLGFDKHRFESLSSIVFNVILVNR